MAIAQTMLLVESDAQTFYDSIFMVGPAHPGEQDLANLASVMIG